MQTTEHTIGIEPFVSVLRDATVNPQKHTFAVVERIGKTVKVIVTGNTQALLWPYVYGAASGARAIGNTTNPHAICLGCEHKLPELQHLLEPYRVYCSTCVKTRPTGIVYDSCSCNAVD